MEYLRAPGAGAGRTGPHPGGPLRPGHPPRRQGLRGVRLRARAASRSRPPWPSPACCATSCATRPSGPWWRRSSPTRPGPSGSSRSSPRRRSTPPRASTTSRSTPTSPCTTPRARRARSSKRGSPKPGALASFTALATAYATWGQPMLPVFLFYSMFGFQRVGDLTWALGDIRGRGILAGCTAGRTTLQGEGLQHDDGQSPLLASTNPAAMIYDASFAYEVAVIMQDAITPHPRPASRGPLLVPHPLQRDLSHAGPSRGHDGEEVRRGIVDGIYRFSDGPDTGNELRASAVLLRADVERGPGGPGAAGHAVGVSADTWAVTSWSSLRTDALEAERWNRLHPADAARRALITEALGSGPDPVVAITDYMRAVPDQVARFIARPYTSLGTDGFGRSDARAGPEGVLRGRRRPAGARRPQRAGPGGSAGGLGRRARRARTRHRPLARRPVRHLTPPATRRLSGRPRRRDPRSSSSRGPEGYRR